MKILITLACFFCAVGFAKSTEGNVLGLVQTNFEYRKLYDTVQDEKLGLELGNISFTEFKSLIGEYQTQVDSLSVEYDGYVESLDAEIEEIKDEVRGGNNQRLKDMRAISRMLRYSSMVKSEVERQIFYADIADDKESTLITAGVSRHIIDLWIEMVSMAHDLYTF